MPESTDPRTPHPTSRPQFRRWLISRRVEVVDQSMEPTLRAGDRLLVERTADPAVGDLVVVRDPERTVRWLVKRVGAIGGQRVWVTRNGVALVREGEEGSPPSDSIESLRIPDRHVFLVSDRPEGARDSRRFGPSPTQLLVGRAWYRYFPLERRQPL